MSSAAEHYDEATERCNLRFRLSYIVPAERNVIIREEIIATIEAAVAEERARCIAVARENTHWFKVELESDCLVCESAQRIISAIERGDEPSDDPT